MGPVTGARVDGRRSGGGRHLRELGRHGAGDVGERLGAGGRAGWVYPSPRWRTRCSWPGEIARVRALEVVGVDTFNDVKEIVARTFLGLILAFLAGVKSKDS